MLSGWTSIWRATAVKMEHHVYLQRIREHMQSGRESGVRATPTFFVNRRIIDPALVDAQRNLQALEGRR